MEYLQFTFNFLLGIITLFGLIIPVIILTETKYKKLGILTIIIYFLILSFGLFTFGSYVSYDEKEKKECYKTVDGYCKDTKENYCTYNCRYMLRDLSDTWGNDTNNQDSISKSIMECYLHCLEN